MVSWLSASVIQDVKEAFRAKSEEMSCMTSKGRISMRADVVLLNIEPCASFVPLCGPGSGSSLTFL